MKTSLFSQSLFALSLDEAIVSTAEIGFGAIELGCCRPHFDVSQARRDPEGVAEGIERAGLAVSALSLFNNFTDPDGLDEQLRAAETFIRLAPVFKTKVVKLTPGPPGSAAATSTHWQRLEHAISRLVPVAREVDVVLAFETHMRQLTDTLASSVRLLEMTPPDAVGLTVDFSNLAFAGEHMAEVIPTVIERTYHTHLKNGYVDSAGDWHFQALDEGLTDYGMALRMLRQGGYDGYLSIECLGPEAQRHPVETARRDLEILEQYLAAL